MPTAATPPVPVRLRSPGDLVAALPAICGFRPHESLVVLSLHGPRRRLGLTLRLDLPDEGSEGAAAELLQQRLTQDRADAASVVVVSATRRPGLVSALTAALDACDIERLEVLHVADGRWWSYACDRACCPPEGTALTDDSDAVSRLAAEAVLSGRAVLESREQLVASIAPPQLLLARASEQALEAATAAWATRRGELGAAAARRADVALARDALHAVSRGAQLDLTAASALAVALHDVLTRDEVATWALEHGDALLALLQQLVRVVTAPDDAPACALLGWVAYARGEGALAGIALDRALASDPELTLATLLLTALEGGIDPREVRGLLRQTAQELPRNGRG